MGTNQGEGNRDADRRYREGVRRDVESGNIEEAAETAKHAREDPDTRRELDEAEQRANRGPSGPTDGSNGDD